MAQMFLHPSSIHILNNGRRLDGEVQRIFPVHRAEKQKWAGRITVPNYSRKINRIIRKKTVGPVSTNFDTTRCSNSK
jgi:hypothetical protein